MEATLNFVNCLVCDVTFCPVTLAPQSEDEKLLDIFCHYLELSPKDVESVYDERVGFPFCDNCRVGTLYILSRLHDQLTSIHNEINQLVTNVCTSIVNIVSRNDHSSVNHSPEEDNAENYSRGAVENIRKSISNRFNPQVSLIRLDFQRLYRQSKNLQKQQQQNVEVKKVSNTDLNDNTELISQVDPSSIRHIANSIVKGEPFSPAVLYDDDDDDEIGDKSDSDSLETSVTKDEQAVENSPLTIVSVSSYGRKIRPTMKSKAGFNSEEDKEENKDKGTTKSRPRKKSLVKNEPKKRGRPIRKSRSSPDPDFNAGQEGQANSNNDEEEDSEVDLSDSSITLEKPKRPKAKRTKRKYRKGGDPLLKEQQREKKLRDQLDPVIEVEPNLFRRKESGWSFRKEEIDGIEIFVCLAEGCLGKYVKWTTMIHHISSIHIKMREKCFKCDKTFWKKEQLDEHNCTPNNTVCKRTQNFGNGQFVYDEIWPFFEVDKVENGGYSLKCGTCGVLKREQLKMTKHIRSIHSEHLKFSCTVCNKACISNSALRKHLSTHSDRKEAVCDQCGEFFKTQGTLRAHIRGKHERAPKSFKCDFPNCDRAFNHRYGLDRHRKQAGHPKPVDPDQPPPLIDPLICPLCGNKFVKEATYKVHQETCRGKKEFICPICQKKSCTAQALRMHMAIMHKDEYMNYPEGRYKTDPNKTADAAIARMKELNKNRGHVRRREKKRALRLKKTLEKLKQLKQNQSTASS